MYTLKSHMSAIEYTCAFHRRLRQNHQNHKVMTSSYHFFYIVKPNHFQNKTRLDSTRHRLNTLKPLNCTPNTSSFEVWKQTISFGLT